MEFKGQLNFSGLYDEALHALAESYAERAESCDVTDFAKTLGDVRNVARQRPQPEEQKREGVPNVRRRHVSPEVIVQLNGQARKNACSVVPHVSPKSHGRILRGIAEYYVPHLCRASHEPAASVRKGLTHLSYRLMRAIGLPYIQNALHDKTPWSSHKLMNRVVRRVSTKKGSSGAEVSVT